MTFAELLEEVRTCFGGADVSGYQGKLAFQFNITGEAGGIFYSEIKDGRLSIEPYEYYDRDAIITISGEDLCKLMKKKLDPVAAFTLGRLHVDGDLGKAMEIQNFL